jgi:two-component system response regulator YesN
MYKLLFAEDESATRNGILESIDWKALGIGDIRAEKNGELAYKAAQEGFCPDILLTDIKMPRMDGIVLSRKIRGMNSKCSILIISGYAEVDYLKSAIQLKAINFVDKPIKLEELTGQIRRAVNEQEEWEEKKELQKTELGSMLRYSGFDTQRAAGILQTLYPQLPLEIYSRAVLIRVLTSDGSPVPDANLYEVLAAADTALSKADTCVCVFAIHKSCLQMSMFGQRVLPLEKACLTLSEALPKQQLYFCAGDAVPLAQYESSLQQASNLLPQVFYQREQHLLTSAQSLHFCEPVQSVDLQPLSQLLLTKDRGSVKKYVHNLIDKNIRERKELSPDRAAELCFRILTKLMPEEISKPVESNWESATEWLASCVFLDRMEQELMQEIDRCFDSFGSDSGSALIDRVLAYIRENYRDRELSLNFLSQKFYVSNVYLCIRFKEKAGKTFVRFLTELRIQEAEKLLHNSDMKVTAIAENVGFDNSSYFTKIFKRETGLTPAEYRKSV